MGKLFWGLFIVFIGVRLEVGAGTMKILPDAAGYLAVTAGLMELVRRDPEFGKLVLRAKSMVVLSTGFMLFQLLAPAGMYTALTMAVYALYGMAGFYFLYEIVLEIGRMEEKRDVNLGSRTMKGALLVMTVSYLCANLIWIQAVILLGAVVLLGAKAAFLMSLYRCRRLCRETVPPMEE